MGYTNYWQQQEDFTDKQWDQVKEEAKYVTEHLPSGIEYQITDKHILIDGGCETFVLEKHIRENKKYPAEDLNFFYCKTREMPYDFHVWHMLVFCAGMINNTDKFSISRDR